MNPSEKIFNPSRYTGYISLSSFVFRKGFLIQAALLAIIIYKGKKTLILPTYLHTDISISESY